ncbi:hypothetical protein ACSIGC_10300 [Tenacibaculum sp. ZS6-P6]|uniref:hypothetical protein n=1 Tax=Tenacibaculum sp. ZS6-P6 TaxID=3447503 RepID=UPI003F97EFF6
MKKEVASFFSLIKQKIPENISLIDEIASVLDINYDAAYRRVNNKTELSFKEALILAQHYKISLNSIYNIADEKSILVQKNSNLQSNKGLESFYIAANKAIQSFSKFKNPEILYAAKDIPLYYLPKNSLLKKFRIYSTLTLPILKNERKELSLSEFSFSPNLIYESICFKNAFRKIKCSEIWNDATIDSALNQIYYCYKINLIDQKEAIQLCRELKELIINIEKQASEESWNDDLRVEYKMYYSKLISLDNSILFKSKNFKSLLVPYIPISYLRIDDVYTCEEVSEFFNAKIQSSKKISGDAEVNRRIFFTSMYEKIDQLYSQISMKKIILL